MKIPLSRVVAGGAVVLVAALIVREAADRFRTVSSGAAPRVFSGRWTGMSYVPRAAAPSKRSSPFAFASAMGSAGHGAEAHLEQTRAGIPVSRGRRLDDVQRTLERCIHGKPADARCWSNLAVVRLEAARLDDDPRGAVDAFGAADRAVRLSPVLPEALFNRAAALEALHLSQYAAAAWQRYLAVDGVSAWAGEARERLAALPRSTRRGLWKSAETRLEKAASSKDDAAVRELVRAFPSETRAMAEWYYLSAWAAAVRSGDATRAAERLALARRIGAALREVNGERLLGDAVAAIDRASAPGLERLVDGHILYGKAKDAYSNHRPVEAQPLFERAGDAFRDGGSPMSAMAAYFVAGCVCDRGEIARSRAMVEAQLAAAPAGYAALRGQLLWQRGTDAVRGGLVYEALNAFRDALAVFEHLHESWNTDFMRSAVCALDAETGRGNEAWTTRLRAFDDVSRGGDPQVLDTAVGLAARSEAVAGRWDTAASLYGLTLESGLEGVNPVARAEASIWFTLAAHRLGWRDVARKSLDPARQWVHEIGDPAMRNAATGRLRVAEAVVVTADDPQRAVELLTANIDEVNRGGGDRLDLAEAYLQRGRAWRGLRREDEAERDFRTTLALLEEREQHGTPDEIRESYFGTGDAATEELVDVLEQQGEGDEALVVADRMRTRAFGRSSPLDLRGLERIPRGTLLLHFTTLPDRLLIASAGTEGVELVRIAVRREDLKSAIGAFREAIATGGDARIQDHARRLYDLVFGPLQQQLLGAATVVLVPDSVLAALPFGALQDPRGAFLIESRTILFAPSAAGFVQSLDRPQAPPAAGALVVGNPHFDDKAFPGLELLPAAEAEAIAVAAEYRNPLLLTGTAATKRRVVEAMAGRDVIELACHAILDARDPARSVLLLGTSGGESGSLYLREVARLKLAAPIVVLAGCRTAAAVDGAPPALGSFAKAFLAAGSRGVIGTLWDVQDEPAGEVSRAFHRNLASGLAPADALRQAQLTMLHSDSEARRSPRAWAAFQAYGSAF